MTDFLIQTIDGQVRHDFSFSLMEAIDYQNWLHANSHSYHLAELDELFEHDYSNCTPSGTVEFVQEFLSGYHNIHKSKPINIPNDLFSMKYLKRFVFKKKKEELWDCHGKVFLKSNDKIKGYTEFVDLDNLPADVPNDSFVISEIVDIQSEWRAFVHNKQLVGLQHYLGDFKMFPDVNLIEEMINDYHNSPPSYTLDVGINRASGTFLLESHNLWSTGFYCFRDTRIIPQMLVLSFRHLIKKGY
ncbi:hypothetical protein BSK59_13765 [Paenibacillus odorifer]|uniref:ATP-grasp domain-containing protein n=1 Tax=Paenibacillus odorifer TaxID=189426 RepID=UPI00096EEAFA|nr:ATP-grasp domain-containing protein [Paenibacillus odorifer]OME55538.1 hypothetical protein BSK59_13765 [Paenibacillus odorifer]